jgi:hypothetical protein
MFWARTEALRPLLDLGLSFDDFPEEDGHTDGTLAHAIERLLVLACERAGYGWLKIANPALYLDPGTIMEIDSPAALDRFRMEHSVMLTGPNPPEPRPQAPPLPTRTPPGLLQALEARAQEPPLLRAAS